MKYPYVVLVVVVVISLLVPKRFKRYVWPLYFALVAGALGAIIGLHTSDASDVWKYAAVSAVSTFVLALCAECGLL